MEEKIYIFTGLDRIHITTGLTDSILTFHRKDLELKIILPNHLAERLADDIDIEIKDRFYRNLAKKLTE